MNNGLNGPNNGIITGDINCGALDITGKPVLTTTATPTTKKPAKERRQSTKKSRNSAADNAGEPAEPEYDAETIANAHLNFVDEHYVCSVCAMRFKQPGNARKSTILSYFQFILFSYDFVI